MIDEGYKKLEIYKLSHSLAVEIHRITLTLPRYETYEEGSQIRRSSKSVSSQIVEGYCLRKYKNEFTLYLNRAYASAEETIEHLEFLHETKSLTDIEAYQRLRSKYEELCKMIFKFIEGVYNTHSKPHYLHENSPEYDN